MPGRKIQQSMEPSPTVPQPLAASFQEVLTDLTESLAAAHERELEEIRVAHGRELDEIRTDYLRVKAALALQRNSSSSPSSQAQDKDVVDVTADDDGSTTAAMPASPISYRQPTGSRPPMNGDTEPDFSDSSEPQHHVPDADVLDRIFKVAEKVQKNTTAEEPQSRHNGSIYDDPPPKNEIRGSTGSIYDDPQYEDEEASAMVGQYARDSRVLESRGLESSGLDSRRLRNSTESMKSGLPVSTQLSVDEVITSRGLGSTIMAARRARNTGGSQMSQLSTVSSQPEDSEPIASTPLRQSGASEPAGLNGNMGGVRMTAFGTESIMEFSTGLESALMSSPLQEGAIRNPFGSQGDESSPERADDQNSDASYWSSKPIFADGIDRPVLNRSDTGYSKLDEDVENQPWQAAKLKVKVNPMWMQIGQMEEEERHAENQLRGDSFEAFPQKRGASVKKLQRLSRLKEKDKNTLFACINPEKLVQYPSSRSRLIWDVMGMVFLGYDIVMVPLQVFDPEEITFITTMNITTGVFWSLDLIASFMVGYHVQGFIEMRPSMVAQHYLKSWFALDFILVFLDWFFFVLGFNSQARVMRVGKLWRGMRVLRLLRLMKLHMLFNTITERIQSEYKRTILGIAKLVVLIVIVNHFLACAWYGLSHIDIGKKKNWVEEYISADDSLLYRYTTSLHWSLTQFTPASMEVVPMNGLERTYSVLVLLFALVTFSSFVSSITQAMTHLRNINARRIEQDAVLRRYLSEHSISNPLVNRVLHFIQERQVQSCRLVRTKERDVELFKALPESVKNELRYEAYTPTLLRHPLFYHLHIVDEDSMRRICTRAVEERSLLIRQELYGHTEVTHMVFVDSGVLSFNYTLGFRQMTEQIHKGQWACEAVLWVGSSELNNPFVAQTNCELLLVNAVEFLVLVRRYRPCVQELTKYAVLFVNYIKSVCNDRRGTGCRWLNMLCNDTECVRDLVVQAFDKGDLVVQQTSIHDTRVSRRTSNVLKGVDATSGNSLYHRFASIVGYNTEGKQEGKKLSGTMLG